MATTGESFTRVKTKIIATVGPASETVEKLAALMRAGADVFRLNLAHGSYEWHEAVLGRIRQASEELRRPVAVLADLGGPKIRLGPVAGGSLSCKAGQMVRFVTAPTVDPHDLTSTWPTLVEELGVGDTVLLTDGLVSLQVQSVDPTSATCRVVQEGEIRTGGGINLPGVELSANALTDKDLADVRWGASQPIDFFGLSFVRRAADVRALRQELDRLRSHAQIVAKIEKPQALEALGEIVRESDAVMVARGDLGVEIDVSRVASVQKQIIRHCHRSRTPVITATQMLESMRSNRLPTRAEATDVANAILDGTDALMLSAETAIGQYPVEAVAMMSRIAREAERLVDPRFGREAGVSPRLDVSLVTESLVEATSRVADQVQATLIVVATKSGGTALVLSKQRGRTPILGVSDSKLTVGRMCLYWGVTPLEAQHHPRTDELLQHITTWAREHGLVARGDRLVLIASTQAIGTGQDTLIVHEVR